MVAVGAWKENRHRELRVEYFVASISRRVVRSTLLRVAPKPIFRIGRSAAGGGPGDGFTNGIYANQRGSSDKIINDVMSNALLGPHRLPRQEDEKRRKLRKK